MRKSILTLSILVVASGCVPTTSWYKTNVSQSTANNDLTTCQAQSTREVPTNTQTYMTGGYFIGYTYISPTAHSYDANSSLREKIVSQCMTGKGYSVVELPLCPASVPVPDMKKRAVITENSCYISIPGGYFAIGQKA